MLLGERRIGRLSQLQRVLTSQEEVEKEAMEVARRIHQLEQRLHLRYGKYFI